MVKGPDYYALRRAIGNFAEENGVLEAMRQFGVSERVARYWKRKVQDHTFHAKGWGGFRSLKFSYIQHIRIRLELRRRFRENPLTSLKEYYRCIARNTGYRVSRNFIRKILVEEWGLSFKLPVYKQKQKFTVINQRRYLTFLKWVFHQPREKLKYLDESHFVTKGMN